MKTIIENSTKLSKFIIEDNVIVTLKDDFTDIGDPLEARVLDLKKSNATLIENIITPPSDWIGNKYKYDNNKWIKNPDWVDPTE